MVRMFPLIVPGPATTLKITGRPELALADRVIGVAPNVTGLSGSVKLIVCFVIPTLKELLVAVMSMAEPSGAGGGVVVTGSVATSVSPVPSALTCSALDPATPEVFVLRELTLSEPVSPVPNISAILTPLTGNELPLSLSCTAAAKFVCGGVFVGGSVLKASE